MAVAGAKNGLKMSGFDSEMTGFDSERCLARRRGNFLKYTTMYGSSMTGFDSEITGIDSERRFGAPARQFSQVYDHLASLPRFSQV